MCVCVCVCACAWRKLSQGIIYINQNVHTNQFPYLYSPSYSDSLTFGHFIMTPSYTSSSKMDSIGLQQTIMHTGTGAYVLFVIVPICLCTTIPSCCEVFILFLLAFLPLLLLLHTQQCTYTISTYILWSVYSLWAGTCSCDSKSVSLIRSIDSM